ncbi:MAG: hypothetical protein J7502_12655 [Flavisolibacter sp.]|nr:hypothetical protein [Flavisolibacter sp.]
MQLLIAILLLVLQAIAGFGVLCLLRIYLKPGFFISLSVLIGVAVFSLVPFLLQLAYVPLTAFNVFASLIAVSFLLNIKSKRGAVHLFNSLKNYRFRLKLYEVPSLFLILLMIFVSVWRCYYYPPTPRDLTSGAEVIAEYAVKEKTMINSVFTVDLSTTNNQFKPPFLTCLQIIYKYAGFPFGQIWLSGVFIFFTIFLYTALNTRLHKIITGLLLVMFIAIPEMYGYTLMALFDYSNAVFFCLSIYFLIEYFTNGKNNHIILSGLLMAVATYVRSETLILAGLVFPVVLFHHWRRKNISSLLKSTTYFFIPSVIIYLLSITIYINYYLPSLYKIDSLLNTNLADLNLFYQRLSDVTGKYLLAGNVLDHYGYFVFIFVIVLCADAFRKNSLNRTSLNWLWAVFIIFAGIPLIGFLFPLYDLDHSTKRGLLKIFPLMLLYMANSGFLVSISDDIKKWERSQ